MGLNDVLESAPRVMSLQKCQKVAHFLPAQIDHEQERGDEEGSTM
jgi:hypothetical protein